MKPRFLLFMAIAWIVVLGTTTHATYFDTGWTKFEQPNGVTFVGRMWGDEWDYTFQTKEGYPFDKNFTDGYYYFALSQSDGAYQLSNLRVGIDAPKDIPKDLGVHKPRLSDIDTMNQATSVTWTLKVILAEFQDVHGNTAWTRANFSNMLFSSNYYNTELEGVESPSGEDVYGSLRDYYVAMSNSNLIITGQILNAPLPGGDIPDWIRLSQNKSYYHNHSTSVFHDEVINLASARGYDTSTSNTTKLVLLYAGNFYLSNLNPQNLGDSYIIFERWGGRGSYDGNDYNVPFGHIGVHAHEFGHFLALADLYYSPYNIID